VSNRLAGETSPYLLQHKDNPVDWYPWGPEALAKAAELDRPILLSIGYSSCHWCHVMAHESFEDPAIAAQMNRDFINIKVDREERPDIDNIYMTALQAMTGQGGWPLNIFLTPEGVPFFGGTYFPPDQRQGMPGFPQVMEAVTSAWNDQREGITENADQIRGLPVGRALDVLSFSPKKGAVIIKKVLLSAIANAEHNDGADVDELKVKTIYVDKATNLRRFTARAKGRGNVILKQTCHIHVVVGDGK